ncbi:MAG: hypothetical protein RLZZ215_2660 [Pseudomonadota bacterium]|jgi:type I restriction enzyme S subunit
MTKPEKKALVPVLRFPEFQNEPEWQETKLGKVAENLDFKRVPITEADRVKGVIPYYGASGVIDYIEDYIFDEDLLCISEDGANLIARTYPIAFSISGKTWVNNHAHVLKFKHHFTQIIVENYLNVKNLENFLTGMAQPKLNQTKLDIVPIPLPDEDEQQKIADCLSSLDDLITAQTQKLAALKAHKKGLMQQLFPAEGETVPKLRFPEFRDGGEWEECTLENAAKYRRGSFPQPYGLPEWYDDENGMPFVQVFDVSDDLKLKPDTKRKISTLATEQSVFIKKGTVIITIQGSIGRVAVTQYDAYIDRTLLLFQKFLKPIEKLFFAYTIQILFEIERQKAPGGIIQTITKEALSSFVVKLPSVEEQQKIADCLSSVDELITAQSQKIEALKSHKKGLMQQLFPSMDEVEV